MAPPSLEGTWTETRILGDLPDFQFNVTRLSY